MADTFSRLQETMMAVLDVPASQVTSTTKAEELENWDSLGQMKLMLALEEEFGVAWTPEEITSLLSVPEILAALDKGQN